MPLAGGAEEKVLDSVAFNINFAITAKGIYYMPAPRNNQNFIEYVDLATRRVRPILTVGHRQTFSGLTVSPDERWILWSQIYVAGSDLMVVENLR